MGSVRLLALMGLAFLGLVSLQSSAHAEGMDLDEFCRSRGYTGVVNLDGTGYGWRCAPGNVSIVADDVCRQEYGGGFRASLLTPPPGGMNDWICERTAVAARADGEPMDLAGYCRSRGYTGVVNLDGTGYGWRCAPGNVSIVADDVCRQEYGGGFRASLLTPPPGGMNDWACERAVEIAWPNGQPMDLAGYCRSHGYTGVVNLDGTGYGWRCVPGNVSIVADDVCRHQYGSHSQAFLKSAPPGHPADWICQDYHSLFPDWSGFATVKFVKPAETNGFAGPPSVAVHLAQPPLPEENELHYCLQNTRSKEMFASCVIAKGLPQAYQLSERCRASNPGDGGMALACSTGDQRIQNAYSRIRVIKNCVDQAGNDRYRVAQCLGNQVLNENDQYYLSCITSNHGDYTTSAVCALDKSLTPEQQIALACAISTGGEPDAFAACAGGQLLSRELDKCWNNGIGTEQGCFGPNNEYRRALNQIDGRIRRTFGDNSVPYQAYRAWQDNVLAPGPSNTVVRTINNGIGDIKNGPSQSNEYVKVANTISNVVSSIGSALGF